jgi:hypothetical protein
MAQLRMNPYYEVLSDVSVASRSMTKGARRVPTPFRYPPLDALLGLEPNRARRRAQPGRRKK